MKNRKQKVVQPRRVNVAAEEVQSGQFSVINAKCPSNHTKISTNSIHPPTEKRSKTRKTNKSASKQNPQASQLGQGNSKSGRKSKKYELPLKVQNNWVANGQQSCREYCVVDENFVPITDNKQQKLMEEMLANTASTSCDVNCSGFPFKVSQAKLRKRSMSSEVLNQPSIMKKVSKFEKTVSKHDKAISNIQKPLEYMSVEVAAVTESFEIGMQYSERNELIDEKAKDEKMEEIQEQKEEKDEEKEEEKEQSQQIQILKGVVNQQSLSDLLFKLEFSHLGDDQGFTHMSSNEKEHFTQLLETVISKLQPKQATNKNILKPIIFEAANPEGRHVSPELMSPKQTINYQKLEGEILMREYVQMNCIQDPSDYSDNNKVNTSLISILNFLGHLFCHIEVQYSQQFVYMIRKMYGLTFREKYRRITRGISLNSDKKFKVIEESLFEDFVNENDGSYHNYNEVMHFKAVFDAFNEHLEEYRPYFLGNGQQFPWAFKMFTTMSEYSIDEQSLQIIFRQAKGKIIEWATLLCGLHVDCSEPMGENNPLEAKRLQKQNRVICNWISEQNFEKDGVQLYSTQALHQLSENIYDSLLQQFLVEGGFCFN